MEKELKSCRGVLLRALKTFESKGHLAVQDFNSFSIMFYHIIFTTYQKIGDLFCPFIFLDFRTVWFIDMWSTPRDYKSLKINLITKHLRNMKILQWNTYTIKNIYEKSLMHFLHKNALRKFGCKQWPRKYFLWHYFGP